MLDIARVQSPDFRAEVRDVGPIVGHAWLVLLSLAYRSARGGRLENPTTGRPYTLALLVDSLCVGPAVAESGLAALERLGLLRQDGDCYVVLDEDVPKTSAAGTAPAAPAAGPRQGGAPRDAGQRSAELRARTAAAGAAEQARVALGVVLDAVDRMGRSSNAFVDAEEAVERALEAADRAASAAAKAPSAGPGRDAPAPSESAQKARESAEKARAALDAVRAQRCETLRNVAAKRGATGGIDETRQDETRLTARERARQTRPATAGAVADETSAPLRVAADDPVAPRAPEDDPAPLRVADRTSAALCAAG